MDDWVDDGDGLDSDSDDEKDSDDEGGGKKKGKKKAAGRTKDSKKKGKKKEEADLEGVEDSDDGDGEGREVDYMSDESSDSEDELMAKADIKGVEADEGLSKMLDSDSSSEDENEKKDDEDEEEDESKPKKDDEDDDGEDGEKGKKGKKKGKGSKNSSRAATPTPEEGDDKAARAEKRKNMVDNLLDPNATPEPAAKKSRMADPFGGGGQAASGGGGPSNPAPAPGSAEAQFEEEVRKYLARKPMTTKEILKKVTSKKSGMNKEEIMPMLVNALKRINPHKHKVKGIMYLSLKT